MIGSIEFELATELARELCDEPVVDQVVVIPGRGTLVAPHHLRRLISGLRALDVQEETAERIDALQLGLGLAIEQLAADLAELEAAGCADDPSTAELRTLVVALRELLADEPTEAA